MHGTSEFEFRNPDKKDVDKIIEKNYTITSRMRLL